MSKYTSQILSSFLEKYHLPKTAFCRMTGISRASLYKYLDGSPIHPFNAKKISSAIEKKYRVKFPYQNLIE